jgi:hypothetical protein
MHEIKIAPAIKGEARFPPRCSTAKPLPNPAARINMPLSQACWVSESSTRAPWAGVKKGAPRETSSPARCRAQTIKDAASARIDANKSVLTEELDFFTKKSQEAENSAKGKVTKVKAKCLKANRLSNKLYNESAC